MLYFTILFILLIILFILYRTKSPFWKLQPVYHLYNPLNYLHGKPYIINNDPIEKNKYFNKMIECKPYSKIDNNTKTSILSLINKHFLNTEDVHYSPSIDELFEYFESQNSPSYISLYTIEEKLVEEEKQHFTTDDKLVGVISSRRLNIEFTKSKSATIPIYYVDHLCVHSKYRNQKIAPQLIQNHERLRRQLAPKIKISLFRRDVTLTSIMPFTIFDCHVFDTTYWTYPPKTPGFFNVSEVDESNIHMLYESISTLKNAFECIITPDITHIINLVKHKLVHIYVAQIKNEILGVYFFRNSSTYFKGKNAGECFGSMFNKKYHMTDLITGFQHASFECAKTYKYRNMLYDDTSHNKAYINHLLKHQAENYKFQCAYYFYNFLIHPKQSSEVFIFH